MIEYIMAKLYSLYFERDLVLESKERKSRLWGPDEVQLNAEDISNEGFKIENRI